MPKSRMDQKTDRRLKKGARSFVRRFFVDEDGNVIMWVCFVMLTMLFISAFAIDLVHAMVVQQQLQASADSAALAAAEDPGNYPTVGKSYALGTTNAGQFSAGSGDYNAYQGISLSTNSVTPLCLTTVAGWSGQTCASDSSPNAMRVTQASTVPTFFARLFGWTSFTPTAVSTATVQGASPLPYNVAILVDSTLSMATDDGSTYCTGLSQEQCALEGVRALLGEGGNGTEGLAPSVDNVALFTFPNVAAIVPSGYTTAGIVSGGTWQCTTSPFPSTYTDPVTGKSDSYYNGGSTSSGGYGYTSTLQAKYNGSWSGADMVPYSGAAWGMPYTFPAIPSGSSASYTPPSGTLGATYEVVPFSNDYRTSDTATTLNSSSNLVKAAGGVSGCGGLAPSNYDGNYGTYYAGALYAAQGALVAEQAANGYPNVMIILGDGNNNGPGDTQSYDNDSPSVSNASPSSSSMKGEVTSTYLSSTQLTLSGAGNTAAYTYPSSWLLGTSNGTYPSWVATCSQAVAAANYIKAYTPSSTLVYTVAYGAPSTSSSSNCGYDRNSTATYQDITPCQTMQWMATGGSKTESTPSNYFYSDYTVTGGDPACKANSSNNSVTSLVGIFQSIYSSLTHVRLIPNSTT